MKSGTKLLGVMAAFAVMLAGIAVICDNGETEGVTTPVWTGSGTQANPYTLTLVCFEDYNYTNKQNGPWFGVESAISAPPGMFFEYNGKGKYAGIPNATVALNNAYQGALTLGGTPTTPGTYDFSYSNGPSAPTTKTYYRVIVASPSIPYNAPSNLTPLVGSNWVYTPTSDSGATVSVTGASWLSVTGNTIYGVPAESGTYNVTVTLTKAGYTTSTHSFTLTVSSVLVPTNSPVNGAIIFPVTG